MRRARESIAWAWNWLLLGVVVALCILAATFMIAIEVAVRWGTWVTRKVSPEVKA